MEPTSVGLAAGVRSRLGSLAAQGMWLLAIDAVTNVADYGFHAYLGRALTPGDFAAAQSINMTLLALGTTFSVMQPVVARHVATRDPADTAAVRRVVRYFFERNLRLGLALMALTWLARRPVASWLNVPTAAVTLAAASLAFAIARPTVAGALQGQQRFVAFGLVRSSYAVGRLALCVLAIALGGRLLSVVAVYPAAGALALAVGLASLGRAVMQGPTDGDTRELVGSWRSAGHALLGYGGYMTMMGSDLIWANRHLPPAAAAGYAASVVLRRVLTVVPAAVVVVLFPNVVTAVERGRLPDRLLIAATAGVLVPTCLGAVLYATSGPTLLAWTFGPDYAGGERLGWMAVAMLGLNMGAIWLNLFLATHPRPFVWLVSTLAVLQLGLLSAFHGSGAELATTFGVMGWLLGVGGLLIYVLWLRPRLRRELATRPVSA
jgi:hypothetical protein